MNAVSLDKLYPYVVPNGYVEWVEPGMWVSWPVSDEVHVALAFDCSGIVRNARPDELKALGLDDEGAAFDRAGENLGRSLLAGEFGIGLATLLDGLEIGQASGSWMAPAGGLMVREFYDNLSKHFGAKDFVALALNQQLLIAFPPDERYFSSASLRTLVDDEFRNHRKPISRSWLVLDGGWPRPYPGSSAF